jgi:hypothetical protein
MRDGSYDITASSGPALGRFPLDVLVHIFWFLEPQDIIATIKVQLDLTYTE